MPGVREHVEDVALRLGGVEPLADVRGAERAVLLPVPLPPRLDLVERVRPPRRRLRLPRVGRSGGAGTTASSEERRGAADGKESVAAPVMARGNGGRPRLELERELEGPLQRQGHHRGVGAGAERPSLLAKCIAPVWDKVLEFGEGERWPSGERETRETNKFKSLSSCCILVQEQFYICVIIYCNSITSCRTSTTQYRNKSSTRY